jgi:hypothetical protein
VTSTGKDHDWPISGDRMPSPFVDRPDHPDFGIIRQGCIEQDAIARHDQDFDAMSERYVDPYSLKYVALQRALVAVMAVIDGGDFHLAGAALWMDGFVQGVRFQNSKQSTAI